MKKYVTVRMGKHVSFFYDKKAAAVMAALGAVAVLLFLVSVGSGEMRISPLEAAAALLGYGEEIHQTVILTFRLPRVLVAWLAGMALAAAGAILQGMVRNPLASPDVLGITGGAAAAVVAFLALFSDENNSLTVSIHWLPLAAFLGANAAAWLVYWLAWKNGLAPLRLVLVGIGISALMQAVTTLLMIVGPIYRASQANVWITGSVYGASWQHVSFMAPSVIGLLLMAVLVSRHVNVQELGDELAVGLGSAVERQRLGLVLLSTALTGGAVAFAGGIGFVGLMAPHMARRLVGSAFGALLPTAALLGGVLVMGADLAGRMLLAPTEIPAGVFTAALGAPYFIYLLYQTRKP